jgi:serine/threonine protein kinase
MTPETPSSHDEKARASWLAAYDEALAASGPAAAPDSNAFGEGLSLQKQHDLEYLENVRRALRGPDTIVRDRAPNPGIEGPTGPAPPATADQGEPALTSLGRFQVRRLLGQGGFGMVFLAYDPLMGRQVALKVPRAEILVTPDLRQRFVRELRAASALDHPNVVPVFETGEVGPVCYIASAYCSGPTLAAWLQSRPDPVPFREAAALSATVAEAVEHAHQRGILHRDLKPANILLARDEGRGARGEEKEAAADPSSLAPRPSPLAPIPKITDFGLAKLLDSGAGDGSWQTRSGAILGTPCYMAPEMAAGKTRELGPAVDIYSLGVILYELLCGRPPLVGVSDLDTLLLVQQQDPVPPSRLRPRLPRDLETICLKALRKEPARRYASAQALADDLRRFLDDQPIHARPVGRLERAEKWFRRRPAAAALIGVSGLAALLMIVGGLWYADRERRQLLVEVGLRQEAEAKKAEAQDQRDKAAARFRMARAAVDRYLAGVSDSPELRTRGLEQLRTRLLESAVTFYDQFVREEGADLELQVQQGQGYRSLAKLYQLSKRLDQADAAAIKARDVFSQLVRDYPDDLTYQLELAASHTALGDLYLSANRFDQAEQVLTAGLALIQPMAAAHPDQANVQAALGANHIYRGHLYRMVGRESDAETAYRIGRAIWEQLASAHPDNEYYQQVMTDSLANLGRWFNSHGRGPEALPLFQSALTPLARLASAHPDVPDYQDSLASLLNDLGLVHWAAGRSGPAEKAFQDAVAVRQKLIDAHPGVADYQQALARTYGNLGVLYDNDGRTQKAIVALRAALPLFAKLADSYPEVSEYGTDLGGLYGNLGDVLGKTQPAEGLPWHGRAITTLQAILTKEPRDARARDYLGRAYWGRADLRTRLGEATEALADWQRAFELKKGADTVAMRASRAVTFLRAGQYVQALAETDELAQAKTIEGDVAYDLARVYALASAIPRTAGQSDADWVKLREQQRARAVTLLRQAAAADYFQNAKRELLKTDADLAAVRGRDDFRTLLGQAGAKDPPSRKNDAPSTPRPGP